MDGVCPDFAYPEKSVKSDRSSYMATGKVLEAKNLFRFFHSNDEEIVALRDVNLEVYDGEIVAIVGPSGSGKSTLLGCLAGIDEPNGGTVRILGDRITRRPEPYRATVRLRNIGFLLQSDNLIDHLTVAENVLLPLRLAKFRCTKRADDLLQTLSLGHRQRAYPRQLSGGEAARAGLAVALAARPKLLLADEPTGEVDAETETSILKLMTEHCKDGGAVIVATHSTAVSRVATRIVQLADGRIIDE
jgi:putative ABC transport system ATP-binding protein